MKKMPLLLAHQGLSVLLLSHLQFTDNAFENIGYVLSPAFVIAIKWDALIKKKRLSD